MFGNLAPGIVTFVSACMQNFMLIIATINKWPGKHIVCLLQKSLSRFICNIK